MRTEQKVMSNEQRVTNNEQKVTSNNQDVTSNKQKVTNNKQKVTSNEQQAKRSASLVVCLHNVSRSCYQRYSVKKVFLKISKISEENTCVKVFF